MIELNSKIYNRVKKQLLEGKKSMTELKRCMAASYVDIENHVTFMFKNRIIKREAGKKGCATKHLKYYV